MLVAALYDLDPTWKPGNDAPVKFINTNLSVLANPPIPGRSCAILDREHPMGGAHHQKLVLVYGKEGLIAYCGGVDLNPDRLTALYDVHCRIKGPIAQELLQVFNERWLNHPDR